MTILSFTLYLVSISLAAYCIHGPISPKWQKKPRPRERLIEIMSLLASPQGLAQFMREKRALNAWPKYKYFTSILEGILHSSREWGATAVAAIKDLREALAKDDRFETSSEADARGAFFQFFMVALITWGFLTMALRVVPVKIPLGLLILMGAMHVTGPFLYRWIRERWVEKAMRPFETSLECLYAFQALSSVGVPLSERLERSSVHRLLESEEMVLQNVRGRMRYLLDGLREMGRPVREELRLLIDEVWFQVEETQRQLQKKQVALKFAILVSCYLSTYFLFLFFLLSEIGQGALR